MMSGARPDPRDPCDDQQSGQAPGLYDPAYEHDACGVGFVADVTGATGRRALVGALRALDNLAHRGAVGADARTSDGAGVLTQLPLRFLSAAVPELAGRAPLAPGDLAVGVCFLPRDEAAAAGARAILAEALAGQGLPLLAWRAVPTDPALLGDEARATLPEIAHLLAGRPSGVDGAEFERRLLLARRAAERRAAEAGLALYLPSFSSRTIVYKGLLTGGDLAGFFPDLADPRYETAVAVFHQRYSTNTAPAWPLAQPFRLLAHNGEINTVQGNRRWMGAREAQLVGGGTDGWGDRLPSLWPIVQGGMSDSASLDNVLELLVRSGQPPQEALASLVGEAWEGRAPGDLGDQRRAFYEYHAPLMEPWDGPAALAFSDGTIAGAALDRNGLRPARYRLTDDDLLVVASEAGVLEPAGWEEAAVLEAGRLGPGQMLAVDLAKGRILRHGDIIGDLADRYPYGDWVAARHVGLPRAEGRGPRAEGGTGTAGMPAPDELTLLQRRFGYSAEDLRLVIAPMGAGGHEAVWSMGDDTPPAVLSDKPQNPAAFFRQRFAQVTNPPIDPLRERAVMALDVYLGPGAGLLADGPAPGRLVHLPSPILTPATLEQLRVGDAGVSVVTLPAFFDADGGGAALRSALEALGSEAVRAVEAGATILIVSDRPEPNPQSPIPSLLAVAAVHQTLIRAGRRMSAEIVAEAGDAWSVHQLAVTIGFGAGAVCPWLAYATAGAIGVADAAEGADRSVAGAEAEGRYLAALDEGLLKVLSKMGISTVRSYHGAGLFEALGLGKEVIEELFPGTPSPLGGIGFDELAADAAARTAAAEELLAARAAVAANGGKGKGPALPDHGFVRFRRDGERHAFAPTVVKALQGLAGWPESPRGGQADPGAAAGRYEELTAPASDAPLTLRDLLTLRPAGPPLPLDEVEAVETIRRRFIVTAMSLGALSPEAYTTLAAGMSRMGARSNSGEGGEDPEWYRPQPDGARRHSRIKQVASARFGVTAEYLVHADELEIKMAQGSKPGEGGQLPSHKVTSFIARLRHAVPGTALISPPPHHDIYSIEDLAQLIYDLRAVAPAAQIGVKLVATAGVGTIAAGVAKAGADYVLVSGHSGGTGASPLGSIKHAGLPWELGLAEAQQTLIRSGLRDRVRVRTDGGLRCARDVLVAAALGAEDYGFGTTALVAIGCDMARQCHLNTCPTGIATQRADLRAKFRGTPEQVIAYFTWLAERVRVLLAGLGLRSLDEAVGRPALLTPAALPADHRAATLDFAPLLAPAPAAAPTRRGGFIRPAVDAPLAVRLLAGAAPALAGEGPATIHDEIRNRDRAVGAELAGALARRRAARQAGAAGPAPAAVEVKLAGSAGQSFGAFCVAGMTLRLTGEANDYVGKSMSGGLIAIRPPRAYGHALGGIADPDHAEHTVLRAPVLIGNTVLYGATGGELFVAGAAGERFAVRNSGATAVVEGVGDHGCEYMTGGTVVVLGPTGRNFAAGMSAGRAYVLDDGYDFEAHCNRELVTLARLDLRSDEAARLRALLERHQALTGSRRTAIALADWDLYGPRFWVVTPHSPVAAAEPAPAGRPARRGDAPVVVRRTAAVPAGAGAIAEDVPAQ